MKLKTLVESIGTIQMYHGGNRWSSTPEIRPTKGRYEGGPGIYFTNNYETTKKYAKGSNVVQLVNIDSNFKDLSNVRVNINDIFSFIDSTSGMKKKKEIKADLQRNSERTGKSDIPLTVLNNLIVNWEAGSGDVGREVANFFVKNGADALVDEQSGGEQWLIIFNPKIIKNYEVVKNVPVENYMLPRIKG